MTAIYIGLVGMFCKDILVVDTKTRDRDSIWYIFSILKKGFSIENIIVAM